MPRNAPTQMPPATRTWLDYESGSAYLGVSVRALQRLVREKKIGCTRLGKRTLFSQDQLDDYIAVCTVNPER
jgi:excisionase family DNA binding protein